MRPAGSDRRLAPAAAQRSPAARSRSPRKARSRRRDRAHRSARPAPGRARPVPRCPARAACASGMAPSRSRAASDAPAPSSRRASGMQPASAAANSTRLSSVALICDLITSSLRSSSPASRGRGYPCRRGASRMHKQTGGGDRTRQDDATHGIQRGHGVQDIPRATSAVQVIRRWPRRATVAALLPRTPRTPMRAPMRSWHCSDEAPRITSMASAFLAYATASQINRRLSRSVLGR